jgi:hypothetical protein
VRLAALLAATALTASSAFAQTPASTPPAPASPPNAGPFSIPMSRPTAPGPVEPLPAPKRFVSKRAITVKGVKVPYTAIAGETYLYNRAAEPIGSIF